MTHSAVQVNAGSEPSVRRALGFVYVGYAFRYVSLLILVPFYGRVLGAAEYGRVLAAMSLFQLVWTLTEYGFPIVGARDTAAAKDAVELAERYGEQVMGRLVMIVPAVLLGAGGTLLSPVLRERPLFGLLATLMGIVSAFNMGWYFQGTLRFRTSVLMEVVGFAISLALVLALVRDAQDGWLVLASLLASGTLATLLAHALAVWPLPRGAMRFRGGITLVRQSTAMFATRGLAMLMASASTYIISLFGTAAEVGWYGAAERLATAGLSLTQPAGQVLIGTVSRRISAVETHAGAYALMRNGFIAVTGFGVVLLLGTLVLSPPFVPLILGPDFEPAIKILQVLGLMFPFAAFVQVAVSYVLIPLRFDGTVSLTTLFSAVVTIGLMFALGQAYGGLGIALARVLANLATALLLFEILRRKALLQKIMQR